LLDYLGIKNNPGLKKVTGDFELISSVHFLLSADVEVGEMVSATPKGVKLCVLEST
jgi:hypothetical protein